MAKRKSLPVEPITGIGRDPESKLTVQKSNPLTALWQSELTLPEFKILDMYLARINPHAPSKRTVRLTKGQLEQALGVTRINRDDLKTRLKHLYQPIDLANGNAKKIHLIGLFEEAEAEQDEYGVWQISLTCTESAMKYIFNTEELGYFRYKLRCITSLTSRYTYILFVYLERNRFRVTWEVALNELKEMLNCHEDALYSEYKRFNERILKKCQKELFEKTECRFTYEPVRRGRAVSAIRFTVETLPKISAPAIDPDQLTIFDINSPVSLYEGACSPVGEPCEFTETEMQEIATLICTVPEEKLPKNVGDDDIEFRRYHYLAEKYAALNTAAERKAAKGEVLAHRHAYLKSIIKRDAGTAN